MRIILVTANLPHGTDEAFLLPEIDQLLRAGEEVLVVPRSPGGPMLHGHAILARSRREGLFSARVLMAAASQVLRAPLRTASAALRLFCSRSPYHFLKNLAVLPKALWLAKLATEWKADHLHSHWAGTTATMTMLASRVSRIPWSFTAHRWDIVENNLLAKKGASASFVRFISEDGLKLAASTGLDSSHNTRVIHMGVPIPGKVQRPGWPSRVVLCPARLVEVKGHRFLLEAWSLLRRRGLDAELWLAGDGELWNELKEYTNSLGLTGSVRFLGAVPHAKLLNLYQEFLVSLVVVPSLDLGNGYREGIPVALIEAMSYGLPVVATPTGGVVELISPGTGVLVQLADPPALAAAIQGLLENPPLREQIGESGRKRVMEAYNIAGVVSELVHEFSTAAHSSVRNARQYA